MAYLINNNCPVHFNERCVEVKNDVNEENDVDDGVHHHQADVLVGESPIDCQVEGNHDHRVKGQP